MIHLWLPGLIAMTLEETEGEKRLLGMDSNISHFLFLDCLFAV